MTHTPDSPQPYDPTRPGPPREVSEDAAAKERSMTAEEWAEHIISGIAIDRSQITRVGRDVAIEAIAKALHAHAEQARAEGKAEGAAEEREACAAIADGYSDTKPVHGEQAPVVAAVMNDTAEKIAAAIRQRSEADHD